MKIARSSKPMSDTQFAYTINIVSRYMLMDRFDNAVLLLNAIKDYDYNHISAFYSEAGYCAIITNDKDTSKLYVNINNDYITFRHVKICIDGVECTLLDFGISMFEAKSIAKHTTYNLFTNLVDSIKAKIHNIIECKGDVYE